VKVALAEFLLANAGLTALVGTRIKWDTLPQNGALPAIALHMVSAPRDYTMAGRDGTTGYLVQMDVWSNTLALRESVAAALISALDDIRNDTFQGAFIEGQRDTFEPGDAGPNSQGATDLFRASIDVRVWASEA